MGSHNSIFSLYSALLWSGGLAIFYCLLWPVASMLTTLGTSKFLLPWGRAPATKISTSLWIPATLPRTRCTKRVTRMTAPPRGGDCLREQVPGEDLLHLGAV